MARKEVGIVLERGRFRVDLTGVQPSQLFICREKLEAVQRAIQAGDRLKPVPVKRLDGRLVLCDGHTRALAALLRGDTGIEACWEDEPLDWNAYRVCVSWCLAEGIRAVADLKDRIISAREYEVVWIGRCRSMHEMRDRTKRAEQRAEERG